LFVDVALAAAAAAYHFCGAIGNQDRKSAFAALIWLRQRNSCLGAGVPTAVMAAISHRQVFFTASFYRQSRALIGCLAKAAVACLGPGG
jgi:hypothetical protein